MKSRTSWMTIALAWMLGILLVQWVEPLPSRTCMLGMCVTSALLLLASRRWRLLAIVGVGLAGCAWASYRGADAMAARLPAEWDGRDLVVRGRIVGLPEVTQDATRFVAQVATIDAGAPSWGGKVSLTWYHRSDAPVPAVRPCEQWEWRVRLKRPRGLVNPGGMDSERQHLARGVSATGYIRERAENRRLDAAPVCLAGQRQHVAEQIRKHVEVPRDAAFLAALAVGDTRGLSREDWDTARANGISHLIAISGFHVGVAAVAGTWLVALLYGLWPRFGLGVPKVQAQAVGALVIAISYSGLAGFGIATIRTLLMIGVLVLCRCLRRHPSGAQAMAWASMLMLAWDPLAVLLPGFWLSFVGVAFLMGVLYSRATGVRGYLRELVRGQCLMTAAMLPLTLWFFGESSLIGALSNLLAIPLVSFAMVPLVLLATAGILLGAPTVAWPLAAAAWAAHGQWWALERIAQWPGAHWHLPAVSFWAMTLAMLGVGWLHAPRGLPLRWLGVPLCFPLLLPVTARPSLGAFQLSMLDVGQGLAVLVRTRDHALLYDAGAKFPSGFDLGEAVVLPAMRELGISKLDLMVVSHADNDHAGGAATVAQGFAVTRMLAGEPERMSLPMEPCLAGQAWEWDGVRFMMMSPGPEVSASTPNDRSCVLLVEHAHGRLLLMGDASVKVEHLLGASLVDQRPLVLQVGHHGSRTSSSADFLRVVKPVMGLVSAGWRNRFGHPHPKVVERFEGAGVPVLNTAEAGALQLDFPADGPPRLAGLWRQVRARYWREGAGLQRPARHSSEHHP